MVFIDVYYGNHAKEHAHKDKIYAHVMDRSTLSEMLLSPMASIIP